MSIQIEDIKEEFKTRETLCLLNLLINSVINVDTEFCETSLKNIEPENVLYILEQAKKEIEKQLPKYKMMQGEINAEQAKEF